MSDKYIPLPQTELNADTIKRCFPLSKHFPLLWFYHRRENTKFLATSAPDYIPLYLPRPRTYFVPSAMIFFKKYAIFYFRD